MCAGKGNMGDLSTPCCKPKMTLKKDIVLKMKGNCCIDLSQMLHETSL